MADHGRAISSPPDPLVRAAEASRPATRSVRVARRCAAGGDRRADLVDAA